MAVWSLRSKVDFWRYIIWKPRNISTWLNRRWKARVTPSIFGKKIIKIGWLVQKLWTKMHKSHSIFIQFSPFFDRYLKNYATYRHGWTGAGKLESSQAFLVKKLSKLMLAVKNYKYTCERCKQFFIEISSFFRLLTALSSYLHVFIYTSSTYISYYSRPE